MTNRPAAVHSNTEEPGGSASNDLNESETSPELQKKIIFRCFNGHLNGVYYTDPKGAKDWYGIIWATWLGNNYSLQSSTMMVKRKTF